MDCLDLKGRSLRSQLSALGYFELSEETLNAFHKSSLKILFYFMKIMAALIYTL